MAITPETIIAQMRRIAKVNLAQYSDANALEDLNMLKDELWTWIVSQVQDKYNWERWSTESVALHWEYTLSEVTSTTAWTKLLNWVSISYKDTTYTNIWWLKYIQAREVNPNGLDNDWDYYSENQSEDDPIYYVADNSFFIAPIPRVSITNWIKLTWIRKIPDYTLTTTEAEMKLPIDVLRTLFYGLIVTWLMNKWADDWDINNAENRWIRKRNEAIKSLEVRTDKPVTFLYPDQNKECE